MYAAPSNTTAMVNEAYAVAQNVAVALLAGWVAERTVDPGFRSRGIAPLAGLLGLYVGRALWSWGDWYGGPLIGGLPVVPAVAGAFAVCAILKLVRLGAAGPRW